MSTTASLGVSGPGYNVAKTKELSELQLKNPEEPSFHDSHRDSCYIFIGGLDYRMTEGDTVVVFSQWGEIVDIKLVRDRVTGESKGFGFLAYEDQRSTDLAVDNANGMRLLGRNIRVDHVKEYVVIREVGEEKDWTPPEAVTGQIQQGASTLRDKRRREEQREAEKRRDTREKMNRDDSKSEYNVQSTQEHPSSSRDREDRRNHRGSQRSAEEGGTSNQNGVSASQQVSDTKRSSNASQNTGVSHKRPRTEGPSEAHYEGKKQRGSGKQDDEFALKKRLWRELRRLKHEIKVKKELLRQKGLKHSDSEA
eukprot:Protomagalhaensia_sp_Gyna_25__635@NODE_129_length_5021_cov_1218_892413_g19_i3_p4_GENE_NODE_129_length_5021_cov_1218_892413_g19_i3NODE_129_length_5021_cov_1218_892413_g19_i3_p4_ORF_typecomplete_len309_score40_87RRM_1/PF00076_22/1_1e17RRM_7/PF16367_5/6_9e07RRM_5/PF13893_6/2_3e05Nup35_RRM_2/PF14605_6/0_13DUF1940/PF09155_10/0_21OB_RNB/PF08206_11/4_6e03OB_RNB/PF08206_11/0_14OB_RNB/PF08206_11/1_1e04_NODE_129_length_5021_cov_1218_892413_g19_i37191645